MKSPFTGKEMTLVKEWRDMTYRKESFQVYFHFYQCQDTGEQFESEEQSQLNFNQVVNQYRVQHHIPFPEEIKKVREKYDLSAAKMSAVMGMGPNSWRNYENGEVPSKVHANLIHLIDDDIENFKHHIQMYADLEDEEKGKILKKLNRIEPMHCSCDDSFYRFRSQPDIFTGFRPFNKEKTIEIIHYFSERLQPYKTKLNKLLFYVDFMLFRENAESMTGLKYEAIPYGPVPMYYEYLYDILVHEGVIARDWSMTEHGMVERFLSTGEYKSNATVLSKKEKEILKFVTDKFRNTTARQIAEISHNEPAWKDNIEGKNKIPFHYGFVLETV